MRSISHDVLVLLFVPLIACFAKGVRSISHDVLVLLFVPLIACFTLFLAMWLNHYPSFRAEMIFCEWNAVFSKGWVTRWPNLTTRRAAGSAPPRAALWPYISAEPRRNNQSDHNAFPLSYLFMGGIGRISQQLFYFPTASAAAVAFSGRRMAGQRWQIGRAINI